ncbi:MAG: UDP-N-acetylglucosamine--N-acetylmuramyl-(pentapeptide) pyrophosphoryl-undecaprenol N-acetylglucosamine transferase [Verrucomicrobia bacterium]|nr:UDP-N-acetylglucosamine--N-acetylmuramyl-(pentapeptide) pyrophosphoryl-undecaprenol N-acetylglucosamine transferase [Verrucomicrobiota bacterium]
MKKSPKQNPLVAIACGGTGGHLYPGIAVAEELLRRDCDVTLLVSAKDVDQHAVKTLSDVDVQTIPAVGLTKGNFLGFTRGFWNSYRAAKQQFGKRAPSAILSMGGFTSAAPAMAARKVGAKVFLHESNTIPGKANRWLAHFADQAFVFFYETSGRLSMQNIDTVGMPVRAQFLETVDPLSARMALGLDSHKPVLLVMGGSQGATGVNDLVIKALPFLAHSVPDLQFLHLTGAADVNRIRQAYIEAKAKAVVHPFLTEMELALGAATVAISRSGASSLAEIAAMRIPSILIPYPHAAENHQYFNALAFVETGAALLFEQNAVSPERFATEISELVKSETLRTGIQSALGKWHVANAAEVVAEKIIGAISNRTPVQAAFTTPPKVSQAHMLEKEANV